MAKQILVVAGDRGGWNAVEQPLSRALDAGHEVRVFFTAACGEQFASGKLLPDRRMSRVERGSSDPNKLAKLFGYSKHHLTVIAASQSEEGAQAARYALEYSPPAPRIAVQDMYGSSMPAFRLANHNHVVECLCVGDDFSRDMALREFPDLRDHIVVTGAPQFDKTAEVKKNWAEKRRQLREAMNLTNKKQLVFLVVGGLNGTAEMLEILEAGIDQLCLAYGAKVILRSHPRATEEDKRLLQQYMSTTKKQWFGDVDRSIAPASEDLLPGVDFVLSGYSTVNYFGIIYEMPGVMYVGTPAFVRDLKDEKGLDYPPEVENGAGWYVQTGDHVSEVVTTVRKDMLTSHLQRIKKAQKGIAALNDGHAADRVWEQMQKLMVGC